MFSLYFLINVISVSLFLSRIFYFLSSSLSFHFHKNNKITFFQTLTRAPPLPRLVLRPNRPPLLQTLPPPRALHIHPKPHQRNGVGRSGLVRIALECDGSDLGPCPLHSIPAWTMYCNGRKIGFTSWRKASHDTRLMLKKMQSMTVGVGVIPSGSRSDPDQGSDVMYMRANYEWVVGGADSESYHLINPDDDCPGQDLSVFLFRNRR